MRHEKKDRVDRYRGREKHRQWEGKKNIVRDITERERERDSNSIDNIKGDVFVIEGQNRERCML